MPSRRRGQAGNWAWPNSRSRHPGFQESGEPVQHDQHRGPSSSAWFTWTAPSTGRTYVPGRPATALDARLGVYTGSAVNTLAAVATNDNGCGSGDGSRIAPTANEGTTYGVLR